MTRPMTQDEAEKAWAEFPFRGDGDAWAEPVAAEFWRMRAEIARLRAALKPFADIARRNELAHDNDPVDATMADCRTAKKALEETP